MYEIVSHILFKKIAALFVKILENASLLFLLQLFTLS